MTQHVLFLDKKSSLAEICCVGLTCCFCICQKLQFWSVTEDDQHYIRTQGFNCIIITRTHILLGEDTQLLILSDIIEKCHLLEIFPLTFQVGIHPAVINYLNNG